jgi:hypothetical protein
VLDRRGGHLASVTAGARRLIDTALMDTALMDTALMGQ